MALHATVSSRGLGVLSMGLKKAEHGMNGRETDGIRWIDFLRVPVKEIHLIRVFRP